MRKLIIVILFSVASNGLLAQEDIYPVYKGCDTASETTLASCFNQNLTKDVLAEFKVPNNVTADKYNGSINVIFIVTKTGDFEVLYVRSAYTALEEEAKRVFAQLPKAIPASYNGRPIDMRFGLPIQIPLGSQPAPGKITKENTNENIVINTPYSPSNPPKRPTKTQKKDLQRAVVSSYFPEHQSELNIPFSHSTYDELSYYYNQNENSHTGFKPFLYSETSKYVDLDAQKTTLFKNKSSKWGQKLWNEHLFKVQKEDYWFTIDPIFDLQIGKDNSDNDYTYNNTRAIQIQGGLGKNFNFSTSFYESQGRFADYFNEYARENRIISAGALVPGRGKAKGFKTGGFDYPVAEAYLTYTPSKFANFQFGHGKNFIGDGYRSMMLSDVATSYPHLKISTQFWKIKYTNVWMWLDDINPALSTTNLNTRKFAAIHHFSWNVNKKLNVSLFEAVITKKDEVNGFDINYFNPIIFYRAVEFSRGSDFGGNALIGLGTKYKISNNFSTYTQIVLDELTVGKIFDGTGYWGNKFGLQLGAKYYNAFKVDNLYLQGEFNLVRPYTYSHGTPLLNYGHFNQPLGHLWGGNFWEFVGIARYKKERWFGSAKLNIGNKGFDINGLNYGGNIYKSYEDRIADTGIDFLQGNNTRIFIADLQGGYVINPATNTKFFAGFTFRKFSPAQSITDVTSETTTWFTVGLKADIFNWYFDF